MRFQVLTAASMKIVAFWDVAPSSVVKIGPDDGAVPSSETSVYFNETTLRYIPEDSNIQSAFCRFRLYL
jgi:hypothetical protein